MRTALASIAVAAWVLLVGAAADFDDPYARTAFALGILASLPVVVAAGWAEGRRRG
jgi:hypothetical protein